ncbi:MAG: WYL domain-containing protein [Anaerolineae bacterium]|nr:WYL domain-containing protein [Anaerolineae bacterium]
MSEPSPGAYLGNTTFTVVDVETTGLSAITGHRICEIAMLRYRGGRVLDTFESLVNPQRPMSPGAAAVNGLTDWQLQTEPIFSQVAERVREMMEDAVLVAHNAPFDLGFLAAEWRRLQWPPRLGFSADTLTLARQLYSFRHNNLGEVARSLRVLSDQEHRAMGDAWTTLRIFEVMMADLNRRNYVTLGDLLDVQGGNVLWPEPAAITLPPDLEMALEENRPLWLRYRSQNGYISERWVEPLDVTGDGDLVYLTAYCQLRGEQRVFRLDRVVEMRLERHASSRNGSRRR